MHQPNNQPSFLESKINFISIYDPSLKCRLTNILIIQSKFFFHSFFLSLTCFYLLIVGTEGYCVTSIYNQWHTCARARAYTHTHTHTHTHTRILDRNSLDEGSVRRTDLYLTMYNNHKKHASCPRRDSNPPWRQPNGRRSTPLTPQPPESTITNSTL